MGLDLTLLVLTHDEPAWGFSHTMLELDPTGIAAEILDAKLPTTPVPTRFASYTSREGGGATHYGETQTTPYDEPLACVTAGALMRFADSDAVAGSEFNRAAWCYLEALAPSTRVALYWH